MPKVWRNALTAHIVMRLLRADNAVFLWEHDMSGQTRFYYFGSLWNAYQWHYFIRPGNLLSICKTIDVVISGVSRQRWAITVIGFVFMIDRDGLAEKPE